MIKQAGKSDVFRTLRRSWLGRPEVDVATALNQCEAYRRRLVLEGLEDRVMLTALPASVEDATLDVLAAIRDNVRPAIAGNPRMQAVLPLLNARIDDDLDLETILSDHLYDPISGYLAGAPTVEGLGPQLDAISVTTADLTVEVNGASVSVDSSNPAEPRLVINFTLDATASQERTAAFPASYIQVDQTTLTVKHALSLPVSIQIPFTSDPIAPQEILVNLQNAKITSSATGVAVAKAKFGMLGLDIASPTLNLNAALDVDLSGGDVGGNVSLAQLTSGTLTSALSLTPTAGSMNLNLPVSTTLAGVSLGASPKLSISIADLFGGVAPTWTLSPGLSALTDFQNLQPSAVFGLLTQLGNKLDDLAESLDLDIPFVEETVSDIARLGDKLEQYTNHLKAAGGGYTFGTYQELVGQLAGQLGLSVSSFNLNYDAANHVVLLTLKPSWNFNENILLDFSEESDLLKITAMAEGQFNASANLNLTIGFDLDPGAATLSERFLIAAGSTLNLAAQITATNIDLGASIANIGLCVVDGTLNFQVGASLGVTDPATESNDGRAYFSEIYGADLGDVVSLAAPTVAISGVLPLDACSPAMNSLLGINTSSLATRPALLLSLDAPNDLSSFQVQGDAEFQSLLEDFTDFSDVSIWQAVGQVVGFLKSSNLEFLNQPLPIINKSVNQLMGLADGILGDSASLNTTFNQLKVGISAKLAALDAAVAAAAPGLNPTHQEKLFHLREAFDTALGQGDLSHLPADLTSIVEGLEGLLDELSGVISTAALSAAVTQIRNLIPSLDTLEDRIEAMFGIADGDFDLEVVTLSTGDRAVISRLTLGETYSNPAIPLSFQVGGSGIPLAVETGGTLNFSAHATLQLDFGFNLDAATPFLLNTSSASVGLGAESTNLTILVSLGGVTGVELGTASDPGVVSLKERNLKTFTGNGSQTVFNLGASLNTTQRKVAIVTVNDVVQTTGVTVNAGNITFASAPASGASVKVYYPGTTDASAGFTLTDLSPDPDGVVPFGEIALSSFGFNIDGLVNARLPVYLPIGSGSAGDVRFFMDIANFDSLYAALPTDIAASLEAQDCDPSLMLDGAVLFLDLLQAGLESDILQKLPIVGDGVSLAGTFIGDLRDMVADLADAIDDADTIIQNVIFTHIGSILVDENGDPITNASQIDVTVGGDECIEINLHLRGVETISANFDIGLDAFIFNVSSSGGVELGLEYDIQLGLGFNLTEGFFLNVNTDENDPEIEFNLNVGLTDGTTIDAELFFLNLNAVDAGNTGLTGTLALDLIDPSHSGRITMSELGSTNLLDLAEIKLSASANVDLDLTVDVVDDPTLDGTFPRLTANLVVHWVFLNDDGFTGELPTVAINDVTLELGTFISRLLGPVLETINDMIEPIKPVLDFLTAEVPVISDISEFIGEGPVTFVDVIASFAPDEADSIVTFINILDIVSDIAQDISGLGTSSLVLNFGDFAFGPGVDLRSSGVTVSAADGSIAGSTAKSDFDDHKDDGGLLGSIMSGLDSLEDFGLNFPLLQNPASIFNLLFGQRVDLVTWDIPRLSAGIDYEQRFGPLWAFPPVFARIFGGIEVFADLGIGLDTRAFENGFDLLKGFYFRDFKDGKESPELGLSLTIGAGAEVSVVVARAGVEGGIKANITGDWHDIDNDGKFYLDELAQRFNQGPECLFELGGSLDAYLRAYAEIGIDTFIFGFITLWSADITLVDVTLFDFSVACPPLPPPVLAHVSDGSDGFSSGTLVLHFGAHAADRQPGAKDDEDQVKIEAAIDQNTGLPIPGAYVVKALGLEQTYTGVSRIYGNLGDFDDDLTLSSNVTIPTTILGGNGNDHLDGGVGKDSISGGGGNDWITGNDGDDTLHGDAGNDALFGGKGNDSIYAGAGTDQLYGEEGNDFMDGGDSDDILYGDSKPTSSGSYTGSGNDTLKGGKGNDQLYGAGGNDRLEGGDGADLIEADAGDDTAYGGAGDDVLRGWDGNDLLYGGDGNDVLRGYSDELQGAGSDDDTLHGDGGFDDIGGNKGNDFLVGGTQSDALLGGEGDDTLLGGWGNDVIRGEAGSDYIEGGPDDDDICGKDGLEIIYGGTAQIGFPYIVLGYVDPYASGGFASLSCDDPIFFIPPTLKPTGEGSVTGQKFHDLNGDGVQDPGEPGLDRWRIQLYDSAGNLIASQLTTSIDLNGDGKIDPETESGLYSFAGLKPGQYTLAEVQQTSWVQTLPNAIYDAKLGRYVYRVNIQSDDALEDLDFGNYRQGQIQGRKFWDMDADGVHDEQEPYLNGWTINLYDADNHLVASAVTADVDLNGDGTINVNTERGVYTFTGLAPDTYHVVEVQQIGWKLTVAPALITLVSGQNSASNDFGNTLSGGHVFGTKWEDLNANGKRDSINLGSTSIPEPGMPGVTIYADLNNNGTLDQGEPSTLTREDDPTTQTNEAGMYWLANLPAGAYLIREVVPAGYRQTSPINATTGESSGHLVQIAPGTIITGRDFGNARLAEQGSLSGIKFNDLNRDGKRSDNEPGLIRWIIYIDANNNAALDDGEMYAITDELGRYSFSNLPAGRHIVREVQRPGWTQTAPAGGFYDVTLTAGAKLSGLDFGNSFGTLTGTNSADHYYLTTDGQRTRFLVYEGDNANGKLVIDQSLADLRDFTWSMRGGNDQLTIDFVNGSPIPTGGISVIGGSSRDTLRILGTRGSDTSLLLPAVQKLLFNGGGIAYEDIDAIQIDAGAGNDSLTVDAANWQANSFFDVFTDIAFHGGEGVDPVRIVGSSADDAVYVSLTDILIGLNVGPQSTMNQLRIWGDPHVDDLAVEGGGGNDRLEINSALPLTPLFKGGAGSNTLAIGAGAYQFGSEIDGLNLALFGDGSVRVLNSLSLASLQIQDNGLLDLLDNDLLLSGGSVSSVEQLIASARNGGAWNRPGLTTSKATGITTLGVIPTPKGILVKYTYFGDVNGDGAVNLNDYFTIDSGYMNKRSGFANGDMNYDGEINLNDYFLIDSAYLRQGGALTDGPAPAAANPVRLMGLKWRDLNGNGVRDTGEPGLAGVTIYLDLNNNGQLDTNEPSRVTQTDSPNTPTMDETGLYLFTDIFAGTYVVREIVPSSMIQTAPRLGYYTVTATDGQIIDKLDFGNQDRPRTSSITGTKWRDNNGNGIRDLVGDIAVVYAEPALAGVTIYLDLNANGVLDANEPVTVTLADDPQTTQDETGTYAFTNLAPGKYVIREIVPAGFTQITPAEGFYAVDVPAGRSVTGLDFGNRPDPGVVHGIKWQDLNGDGVRDRHEPGLAGVVIYADLNNTGRRDQGEPWTVTMADDPKTTGIDETGLYWLTGVPTGSVTIREVVPKDYIQTFPANGVHVVTLVPGQVVSGKDFGNQLRPGTITGVKWKDLDADRVRDDNEPGLVGVIVYVDYDNDGRRDYDEPWTTTAADGSYTLTDVAPGTHAVREQVPAGMVQSYPGVALVGHDMTGKLYDISLTTGLAANSRPTAGGMVGITLSAANGKFYSLTTGGKLLTVHPTAGTHSAVANLSFTPQEGDLDFDPITGRLYGMWAGTRTLYIINTGTGAATAVGNLPSSLPDPSAMAFDAAGNLYVVDAQALRLVQINKNNGAAIRTVSLTSSSPLGAVAGMTFDPLAQTLYLATGQTSSIPAALYTVDLSTGRLNKIGNTGADIAGLEFIPLDHHLVTLAPGQTVGNINFGNYQPQFLPDGDDFIQGGSGNDTVYGDNATGFPPNIITTGGNDTVQGGLGVDLLYGQDQHDLIDGGDGNDLLYGNEGDDTLNGGAGHDTAEGSLGDDTYAFSDASSPTNDLINEFAGEGSDTIDFSSVTTAVTFDLNVQTALRTNNLTIDMQDGFGNPGQLNFENVTGSQIAVNNLIGHSGDNRLIGGSKNDTIIGGAGSNYLFGRDGDDTFIAGNGADEVYGDGGYDRLDYSTFPGPVTVNLQARTATGVLFFAGVELFVGSTSADTLIGFDTDTTWTLTGGNKGNVTPAGNPLLTADFVDFENLTGGAANDIFAFANGTSVTGTMDGGAGADTLDYSQFTTSVTVDLSTGSATGAAGVVNIENATGGSAADLLIGDAYSNVLRGNAGDDRLIGNDGNDSLYGGDDNDMLEGGLGDDAITGEKGKDSLLGGVGNDALVGGDDSDTLDGSAGNDALLGYAGDDLLLGGDGNDSLAGMDGNDQLDGGNGDDYYAMTNDGSTDTLIELLGGGADTLTYVLFNTPVLVDRRTNTATGAVGLGNIELIVGGSAMDTLIAEDLPNTWNITGPNAGNINSTFAFSAFERLVGGSDKDTFKLVPAGSVSGPVDGGAGYDALDFSAFPGGVQVNLGMMTATSVASFSGIEGFIGTAGVDKLIAANMPNTWNVTAVNAGNINGAGNLDFAGFENLTGGVAADTFIFGNGIAVAGQIDGGGGADTLDYQAYSTPITANLQTATITGAASFAGIERLKGGISADTLVGSNVANTWHITSLNAGDLNGPGVFDFSGIENLTGGTAADTFAFSSGAGVSGVINGQGGFDWLDYSAYTTAITANLALNSATGAASALNIEGVRGGSASDVLIGNGVSNELVGNNGDDILVGNAGADTLDGGFGRDLIIGGDGADNLFGRAGDDILIGGTTSHDANVGNLQNIRTRWLSANTYATRISNLKTSAPTLSPSTTVFSDGDVDTLTGGSESDWFFRETGVDVIADASGEVVDPL